MPGDSVPHNNVCDQSEKMKTTTTQMILIALFGVLKWVSISVDFKHVDYH